MIIALRLVLGGALSGGLYQIRVYDGESVRFNCFTGQMDWYRVEAGRVGWARFPNTVDYNFTEVLAQSKSTHSK